MSPTAVEMVLVDKDAPVSDQGVVYQTDQKGLVYMKEHSVGLV